MALSRCILVFGGTFDPPHLAHTTLPPLVADRLVCEQILYVPAACNPLKEEAPATSAEHRVAMLTLALADVPRARICTVELDRPGPSYTVDTLVTLREQYGRATELRLLVGADHALRFRSWKDWRRILELATPAVMLRPPLTSDGFLEQLRATYPADEAARWHGWAVRLPLLDISSSEVRRRLEHGGSLEGLLDPAVIGYIRAQGLYGATETVGQAKPTC